MANPQIPNLCLHERAGSRFIGARLRGLRRPSRRAAIRMRVPPLLAIYSAHYTTDLRQMRRSIASSQRGVSRLF